jgi:carbon-monoxide dehydrogenase medium subunit
MPISHEFDYKKPATIDEAVEILAQYGDKAKILAGGTDLVVMIKEDILTPEMVIDIKGIKELKEISFLNDELKIGAGVTFFEIEESDIIKQNFRILCEAAGTVASVGVRNAATLVGNINTAVPSLDSAPALMVYDAVVHVKSKNGERTIAIEDWFTGPKRTALKSDEMVVAVSMKKPNGKSASCYKKLGRYKGEDLAQAGVGVLVSENKQYKISFCAVGPVPTRAHKIEDLLNGKELTAEIIAKAQDLVEQEISPITDIRSSKEYRTQMVKVMLERALNDASAMLAGKETKLNAII